jgi:EAL domain-containing protein (putative c-di-GMP-specific phosphodiesterase class I)
LIEAIGDWVVEEISRQDPIWRAQGLGLSMGFNLSPRQIWAPDVTNRIMSRLEAGGVEPQNVTVEITESSAVKDFDRWHFVLRELHEPGFGIIRRCCRCSSMAPTARFST